jgi:hypothetical protein
VLVFRSQASVHCLSAAFAILVSTCSVEDLQSFPLTITKATHDLHCQDQKIGREMSKCPNPDACYLQQCPVHGSIYRFTMHGDQFVSLLTHTVCTYPCPTRVEFLPLWIPIVMPVARLSTLVGHGPTIHYPSMPTVVLVQRNAAACASCREHIHTTKHSCMPLYKTCPALHG